MNLSWRNFPKKLHCGGLALISKTACDRNDTDGSVQSRKIESKSRNGTKVRRLNWPPPFITRQGLKQAVKYW